MFLLVIFGIYILAFSSLIFTAVVSLTENVQASNQCSRIRVLHFFKFLKKNMTFLFFWNYVWILDVTNWSNHWSLVTEFSEFGVPRQLCTCVCFRYWKRTKMLKKCRRSTQIWKKRFCSAVHYSNFRLISGVIKLVTYGRANRQTVKGIAMQ